MDGYAAVDSIKIWEITTYLKAKLKYRRTGYAPDF
jgi:hypothetical protein